MRIQPPEAVRDLLQPGDVLCRSALSFHGAWRLGLFRRHGAGLAVPPVFDGFVADLAPFAALGGYNSGYASPFTHAWWRDAAGWRCVGADGQPLAWQVEGGIHTRRGAVQAPRALRLEVEPGWVWRRVTVVGDGETQEIAHEHDAAPLVDPSYDRDLLSADLAWLEQLAASLAAALGVPLEMAVAPR